MTDIVNKKYYEDLYADIKRVLTSARTTAIVAVNSAMVKAYWAVGKLIVDAQGGEHKAAYGYNLIDHLADRLTAELGKGFTRSNLRTMRQFYLMFPNCHSLRGELSWTHYRQLIRVSNDKAREYYAEEAAKGKWSVRQLERQIHTQSFERLLSSIRDDNDARNVIESQTYTLTEKGYALFQSK